MERQNITHHVSDIFLFADLRFIIMKIGTKLFLLGVFWQNDEQAKQYVHMLNSTLTATERTICCILENYQNERGVEIPKVLQPYMGGIEFLAFKTEPEAKTKKSKAKVGLFLPPIDFIETNARFNQYQLG